MRNSSLHFVLAFNGQGSVVGTHRPETVESDAFVPGTSIPSTATKDFSRGRHRTRRVRIWAETLGTELLEEVGTRRTASPRRSQGSFPGLGPFAQQKIQVSLAAIFVLFAAVYCLGFVWGDAFANDPIWKRLLIQYGFIALVGLCFVSVACAFYDRVEISEHSLTVYALFRRTITVSWRRNQVPFDFSKCESRKHCAVSRTVD